MNLARFKIIRFHNKLFTRVRRVLKNCTKPFLGIKFDNHGYNKKSKIQLLYQTVVLNYYFLGWKKIKCLPKSVGFFHVNPMVLWSFWNTHNQQFFESEFFKCLNPTVLQLPKISHGTQVSRFFDSEFFSKTQNQWVLQKSDTRTKWVVTGSERGNPILENISPSQF